MAESVTSYVDQNLKSKCPFRSSKSFYLKKRFKESFKMCVNHEDLDVDINFVNEGDEETESYRGRGF